jgi:hypothetical protein
VVGKLCGDEVAGCKAQDSQFGLVDALGQQAVEGHQEGRPGGQGRGEDVGILLADEARAAHQLAVRRERQ